MNSEKEETKKESQGEEKGEKVKGEKEKSEKDITDALLSNINNENLKSLIKGLLKHDKHQEIYSYNCVLRTSLGKEINLVQYELIKDDIIVEPKRKREEEPIDLSKRRFIKDRE